MVGPYKALHRKFDIVDESNEILDLTDASMDDSSSSTEDDDPDYDPEDEDTENNSE